MGSRTKNSHKSRKPVLFNGRILNREELKEFAPTWSVNLRRNSWQKQVGRHIIHSDGLVTRIGSIIRHREERAHG